MACSNVKIYSTKVIVENIPAGNDQKLFNNEFERFGSVFIHWPLLDGINRRTDTAHLHFDEEISVQNLIGACVKENDEYFYNLSLQTNLDNNKVKILPWELSKAEHSFEFESDLDLSTIFEYPVQISGIKFPMTAEIFGSLMENYYNGVIHCRILPHRRHNYATDSAIITFNNRESYKSALTDGVLQLNYKGQNFIITMKPYPSEEILCNHCEEREAPLYCGHPDCLTYVCRHCYIEIHKDSHMMDHKDFKYSVKTKRIVGE